ncbi:MAG: outer membrane beta-barrel protein [Candidatus Sericytochromatia bacterium]|nr:outer membrane beta-barrel protein [Candidatus Sericytochromatia bacterium]
MKKTGKTLVTSSIMLLSLLTQLAYADETTTKPVEEKKMETAAVVMPQIKIEGYVDTYYAIDTDTSVLPQSADKRLQNTRTLNAIGFRKNEVNINTAQVSASINADWYRSKLSIAYGTIPLQSWPASYLNLQEANLGFKLRDNLWLDGGLFLTHIGGESLLPRYNWLSTLSLTTMFEPFYQGGVKLTFKPIEQFEMQLHLLNGYGLLEAVNPYPSFGWLFNYTPMSNFTAVYSGYAGNPNANGAATAVRLFHDVNLSYQITEKFGLRGEVDVATQSDIQSIYHSEFLTAHYDFTPMFNVSLRGEYVNDEKGMLSAYPNLKDAGITGAGVTLGGEFKPSTNSYVRLEGRELILDANKNKIFKSGNDATSNRFELMLSSGIWF